MEGVATAAGVGLGQLLLSPDKTSHQSCLTGSTTVEAVGCGSPIDDSGASSASFHTAVSDASFTGEPGSPEANEPPKHSSIEGNAIPANTAMEASDDVIGNVCGDTLGDEGIIGCVGNEGENSTLSAVTDTSASEPTANVQEKVAVSQSEEPRLPRHTVENGEVDTSEHALCQTVESVNQKEGRDELESCSAGVGLSEPPATEEKGEERESEAMECQNQAGDSEEHNVHTTEEAEQAMVKTKVEEEAMEIGVHETTDKTQESKKAKQEIVKDDMKSPLKESVPSSNGPNESEKVSLSSVECGEVGGGGGGGEGESTPSVSSSGYGGSRGASPEDDPVMVGGVITEDMKEEEKRLRERESREQSAEVGELSQMKEYQRYMRLQHLLQKSSIYSKFLLERMENQVQEKKKNGGKAKRKPGRPAAAAAKDRGEKESEAGGRSRRNTRSNKKRKAEEPIELSRFMDNKGKLKQMKLDKGGGVSEAVDTSSSKKTAADETGAEKERMFRGKPIPAAQPQLMTGGIMRSYQVEGMDWIKVLYENGVNGILADEMGLGKTLQVIGVIAHLIEMGVKGPFLVAAPLSTLPNWVSEFKKFTPKIPVILYHGSQEEREKMRRKMFSQKRKSSELDSLPVVVTSYEICMRDQKYLMYRKWRFMVVDEGHRIKNLNCKLIRALKSYDAANRLLLTGTPLQNNLAELWSLLNFILPDIFDDLNGFQSWFDFDVSGEATREKIIAQEREQNVLSTLHQILTPFLLRRLKMDVEFSLPPKKEVLVYAPLTAVQQKYYTSLLDRTILEMVKGKSGDGSTVEDSTLKPRARTARRKGYAQLSDEQFESVLSGEKSYEELVKPENDKKKLAVSKSSVTNIKLTSVWMMLRKCCNHPYLLEFPMTSSGEFRIDEDLVTSCGKMMILDRLLPPLIRREHKTIIFSQFTTMLDLLADYLDLRSISFGRLDGQMPFTERQRQMAIFQGDPDCWVFLTSTRAGGLGINLTAADTVIIYDSDWNPQADLQAQDRCHRIGQTKPVMVYRLVTANTFDQRIVERANSKRRLEKMVIHKGKFKGYSGEDQQLSLEDLTSLLQSVDHETVVDSNDVIISDKALDALLDRSIGTSGGGEAGEGAHKEMEGVFKVIHDQDLSRNSLPSINNSTTSEVENMVSTTSEVENTAADRDREDGGREGARGEQNGVLWEQDSSSIDNSTTSEVENMVSTTSEVENTAPDRDGEDGGREGARGEQNGVLCEQDSSSIDNSTTSEVENMANDNAREGGRGEGENGSQDSLQPSAENQPPPATEKGGGDVTSVEKTLELPQSQEGSQYSMQTSNPDTQSPAGTTGKGSDDSSAENSETVQLSQSLSLKKTSPHVHPYNPSLTPQ